MRGRLGLANRFRTDRSWLWIDGTDLTAPCVYSYSTAAEAIDRLRPGDAPPALDPDLRRRLFEAGVIGSAAEMARERKARADLQARAGRELNERRYTVLPRVIAPRQLVAARRYYRDLIGEGFLARGDKDWPDRHFSGRDPIGYFFQQQLTDLVSGIAGQPVKPSFSFFASYRTGSVLPAHRDREQCEYAVSIQLDYSPDPEDVSPWPLHLQPPGTPAAEPVPTALGGAVLYFGREVRHHRDILTQGNYSRHWFFFYVAESFDGPLD
jgi:hypothetical protein